MGFFYGLCIALPAILLAIVYYHIRSRGAAFVFTVTIRLILSRYLKSFSVNRISLFPLTVDGFQVTTKGTRQLPEITVTWKSLKVHIDLRRFWRNYSFNWNVFEAAAAAAVAVIMENENNSKKFICIRIKELVVSSPNLQFKNILNPSSSVFSFPTVSSDELKHRIEYWWESIKRKCLAVPALFSKLLRTACLQSLLDLFLIQLDNLKVSLELPTHLSSIEVSALQCLIYAGGSSGCSQNPTIPTDPAARSTSPDGLGVLLAMDMKGGRLSIMQNNEVAFDYSGTFYRFSIDVHIPSKHMTVSFCSRNNNNNKNENNNNDNNNNNNSGNASNITSIDTDTDTDTERDRNRNTDNICSDTVSIRVQSFVEFYTRFQSAEDDAMELKLAKGLGSSGKIRCMNLSIESLSVGLRDFRNPREKIISVSDLFFGLRTFRLEGVSDVRLGGGDWLGGMGVFSDLFDTVDASNQLRRVSVNIDKETTISAKRIEWLLDGTLIPPHLSSSPSPSPSSSSSSSSSSSNPAGYDIMAEDSTLRHNGSEIRNRENSTHRRINYNSNTGDSSINDISNSNYRESDREIDRDRDKDNDRDRNKGIARERDKEKHQDNNGVRCSNDSTYNNDDNNDNKNDDRSNDKDEIAIFESIVATKSIRIANSGDYTDTETLIGSVRTIRLESLSADTLDWQLIAQTISNSLPISRFSHIKHTDLDVNIENLIFSISPQPEESGSNVRNCKVQGTSNRARTHEEGDVDVDGDGDEDGSDDRLVSFHFLGLHGHKSSKANDLNISYSLHSEQLEIESSLAAITLQKEYNMKVIIVTDDDNRINRSNNINKNDNDIKNMNLNKKKDFSDTDTNKRHEISHCARSDRVGMFYSFTPFELTASVYSTQKMQIESIKAEIFSMDFMSSTSSSSSSSSSTSSSTSYFSSSSPSLSLSPSSSSPPSSSATRTQAATPTRTSTFPIPFPSTSLFSSSPSSSTFASTFLRTSSASRNILNEANRNNDKNGCNDNANDGQSRSHCQSDDINNKTFENVLHKNSSTRNRDTKKQKQRKRITTITTRSEFLRSTLDSLWEPSTTVPVPQGSGSNITCNLGDTTVQLSAAGALKMTVMNRMVRNAIDRVTVAMNRIKEMRMRDRRVGGRERVGVTGRSEAVGVAVAVGGSQSDSRMQPIRRSSSSSFTSSPHSISRGITRGQGNSHISEREREKEKEREKEREKDRDKEKEKEREKEKDKERERVANEQTSQAIFSLKCSHLTVSLLVTSEETSSTYRGTDSRSTCNTGASNKHPHTKDSIYNDNSYSINDNHNSRNDDNRNRTNENVHTYTNLTPDSTYNRSSISPLNNNLHSTSPSPSSSRLQSSTSPSPNTAYKYTKGETATNKSSQNSSKFLTLGMEFSSFEYQSTALENRYQWDSGSAVVNDFAHRCFMSSSGFVYHTIRPPNGVVHNSINHHNGDDNDDNKNKNNSNINININSNVTVSSDDNEKKDNSNVDKNTRNETTNQSTSYNNSHPASRPHECEEDGIGIQQAGVQYTTVKMTDFNIGISPFMQLGVTVEGLMAQYDGYRRARDALISQQDEGSSCTVQQHEQYGQTGSTGDRDREEEEEEDITRDRDRERERSFSYNAASDTFEFEDLDSGLGTGPADTYDYQKHNNDEVDRMIEEQNKRTPSVTTVHMGYYRFTMDAMHGQKYVRDFSVLTCTNLKVKIDATKNKTAVFDEIATLDFGPEDSSIGVHGQNVKPSSESKSNNSNSSSGSSNSGSGSGSTKSKKSTKIDNSSNERRKARKEKKNITQNLKRNFIQYKHSGGIVTVSQERMVLHFSHQKEPFMDTHKWRMTGPIYLASAYVFDGLIKTEDEEIILTDTTYHSTLLIFPQIITVSNGNGTNSSVSILNNENDMNNENNRNNENDNKNRFESHGDYDDFFDTSVYASSPSVLSPLVTEESPASRTGYDISSTDGSYGSAIRTYGYGAVGGGSVHLYGNENGNRNGSGNENRKGDDSNRGKRNNYVLNNGSLPVSLSLAASMTLPMPVPVPSRRAVCVATVVRSAAPVKVYWDATATAASLDIWLDDNTKDLQDSFNASLVRSYTFLLSYFILI